MVHIITSSRYKIDRKRIKNTVAALLEAYGLSDYQLNCIFVGKTKMKAIALTYKKENTALPVLSFSYKETIEDGERLLGEVFLCYPQIVLLAAERNKKVEVMVDELLKHGVENLTR